MARTRQPQGMVRIAPEFLARGVQFAQTGRVAATAMRQFALPSAYNCSLAPTPDGIGLSFTGGSTEYARFDTDYTISGTSECSVEFVVYGTSFPSLAGIVNSSVEALTDGTCNLGASENGSLRGSLSFQGGPPCNVYWWGGANDYNSGVQFETNKKQHIVITKASGTDACQITVYRNGAQIAQGNSSGGQTFVTSGPYLYMGGRHYAGAASITGAIPLSVFHSKLLTAAEVVDRYTWPHAVFADVRRRLWIQLGAAAGGDTYTLTANDLTSAVPTLGTPALTQDHAVTATGLTSSSPTEGQPALSQDHVVTATGLTGSAPTEGTPALSQLHELTATALTSSAPTLGTPALSIQAGDTWNLIANELTSSATTLGTPALTQDHVIVATALTSAVPSLGTPALTQNHDLGAAEIAGSAPLLGTPAILSDTYTLTADNLVGSAAILANPQIIVDTSTVTVESITASGGGGASTKRWMKESGLEDDIDREARKLGLKLPKKPAKKTKQLLEEEIEEIVEEELEEQIEELKQEEKEEFVSREEFARLEVVAEKRNTELLERLDVMEARLMRQLKRNEEEYLIWRALAERAI